MFTTFYSYKGGVGRSMALANVAWLLANHSTEPATVLAIDFDLNAPGLHRMLEVAGDKNPRGIVDFIHTFITEARIDSISDYIYPTKFANIDILPAGSLNVGYQERLESINWKDLYESAHGFELIDHIKRAIKQLPYDYVLIDSLTGYSDVGGICVRQLPDSVVLLFRLNDQNLEGIETVYKSIRAGRLEQTVPVIPVITPAWPFVDSSATDWYEKAEAIFTPISLSQVSFDAGLSFGESIVSKDQNKGLKPRVLADYVSLMLRVRSLNADDPLTLWNNLRNEGSSFAIDSINRYQKLLGLRPNNENYWRYLPNVVFRYTAIGLSNERDSTSNPLRDFGIFVNTQCDAGNKYALLARAQFETLWNPKGRPIPINDLNRSLSIDPDYKDALMARGNILQSQRKFDEAVLDFLAALSGMEAADVRRPLVHEQLGSAYLDLRDGTKSVEQYEAAIKLSPRDSDLYAGLSRALYLVGQYQRALDAVQTFRSLTNDDETTGVLLPIQIRAALGEIDSARVELENLLGSRRNKHDLINIGEAFLSIDPSRALELFNQPRLRNASTPMETLKIVASILIGSKKKLTEADKANILADSKNKKIIWSTFELAALLRAKTRSRSLTPDQTSLFEDVLERLGPMLPTFAALRRR